MDTDDVYSQQYNSSVVGELVLDIWSFRLRLPCICVPILCQVGIQQSKGCYTTGDREVEYDSAEQNNLGN